MSKLTTSVEKNFIRTRAPSNIALIKYMGKKDSSQNIPSNSSLSMTLNELSTWVELRLVSGGGRIPQLRWVSELPTALPPSRSAWEVPQLSEAALQRIQRHHLRVSQGVSALLETWGLARGFGQDFEIRTANNFPASSGIASSASSFAALTLALACAAADKPDLFIENFKGKGVQDVGALASFSRQGSGSSCRSFGGPWVLWSGERVDSFTSPRMPEMAHFVLLIRKAPKTVSSSEAHLRVESSPLWMQRPERAERRVLAVQQALNDGNIRAIALETWQEAWEMHSLFHTSAEPFSYWEPGTIKGLHYFSKFMSPGGLAQSEPPPIVTLDAGPNIHVIVPRQSQALWRERLKQEFPECELLEDAQGLGAQFVF